MQEPELALFALVIGHLLGDFVFQTQRDIARKKEHEWSAYASHAAIHYATAIFCLAALADVPMLSGRPYVAVLLIVGLVPGGVVGGCVVVSGSGVWCDEGQHERASGAEGCG